MLKLSIVDQSPVPEGTSPAGALQNSISLARLADRLGYERYWFSEHHAMDLLACPAPEVMIARIGAETTGIRIGSGGVLLPYYSPMKVAETFRMLHALYPDRVDLGIGRAPGGSRLEAVALSRDRNKRNLAEDFPEQLAELRAFLNHEFPPDHPFARITVSPEMPGRPELWMLGSSLWSAEAAAENGLPYAFAHFIDPEPTRAAIEHYRSHFVPVDGSEPRAIVALGAICAETSGEAERLAASTKLLLRRIRQGDRRPVPCPDQAVRELRLYEGSEVVETGEWPRYTIGDPEQVHLQLSGMADQLGVEEVMVVTIVHDHAARLRSYELLAEAFGLERRG